MLTDHRYVHSYESFPMEMRKHSKEGELEDLDDEVSWGR
jgi:hypothetical protein